MYNRWCYQSEGSGIEFGLDRLTNSFAQLDLNLWTKYADKAVKANNNPRKGMFFLDFEHWFYRNLRLYTQNKGEEVRLNCPGDKKANPEIRTGRWGKADAWPAQCLPFTCLKSLFDGSPFQSLWLQLLAHKISHFSKSLSADYFKEAPLGIRG